MSFEERGTWLYAVVAIAVAAIYFLTILGQLPNSAVTEIDYQRPLLTAVGAAIVLSIVGMIGIGIASPNEAGKSDQRDKEVNRLGEYVGGIVLGVGMLVPFGLAMAEAPHFWIANAMYLDFVAASLIGTAVKLAVYRRGF
jgi:drug/metabolite transporter (DMT)-like permease